MILSCQRDRDGPTDARDRNRCGLVDDDDRPAGDDRSASRSSPSCRLSLGRRACWALGCRQPDGGPRASGEGPGHGDIGKGHPVIACRGNGCGRHGLQQRTLLGRLRECGGVSLPPWGGVAAPHGVADSSCWTTAIVTAYRV